MLFVPYELTTGPHGLSLHVTRWIPKGEIVYHRQARFLLAVPSSEIARWPLDVKNQFMRHAYRAKSSASSAEEADVFVYIADDSRFMNHSDTPSVVSIDDHGIYQASCDLHPGDELTWDYAVFAKRGEACFNF